MTIDKRKVMKLGPLELNVTHNMDCLYGLSKIPTESIDVAVTSPPYWGQRISHGFGLEEDPRDYINNIVKVLREVMRCLKQSGTLWLNIGDAYNTPINWREVDHSYSSLGKDGNGLPPSNVAYTKKRGQRRAFVDKNVGWLRYGNLLGLPYRVVITLVDMGYYFRGEIIWEKSRPLPEGICRRPHRKHEGIYIISKSEQHSFQTKPAVGSIWKLKQTPNKTGHCSSFPIDLPIRCINAANIDGSGIVLDPFMGSGTTGRAALMLNHSFIGFEIDEKMSGIANENTSTQHQQKLKFA